MSNLNVNNYSQTQSPLNAQNTNNQAPKDQDVSDFERAMQSTPEEEKSANANSTDSKGAKPELNEERKLGSQLDQLAGKLLENKNANNAGIKGALDKNANEAGIKGALDKNANEAGIKAALDKNANDTGIKGALDKNANEAGMKGTLDRNSQLSGQKDKLIDTPSPDSLLSSLFSNTLVSTNHISIDPTKSTVPVTDIPELVDKLVERILVADTKNGTEIRISLNDGTMAGTEIKLIRGLDGQLLVNIASNNANSFQSLVAAQDSLRQALTKTNNDVRVEITNSQSEQGDANNPNQRSRGYYGYPDPE